MKNKTAAILLGIGLPCMIGSSYEWMNALDQRNNQKLSPDAAKVVEYCNSNRTKIPLAGHGEKEIIEDLEKLLSCYKKSKDPEVAKEVEEYNNATWKGIGWYLSIAPGMAFCLWGTLELLNNYLKRKKKEE